MSPKFIYKYFIFSPDNHFTHLKIVKKVKGVVIPFRDQNNHMVPLNSYVTSQQTFVGLQDVLKTSSTRLQRNNFTSSKTSWRRPTKTSWRRLEDVFKTSRKTSWRHLQDVIKTSWKTKKLLRWRRLQDVLKTCLEEVLKTCLEDVLKTYLEDVFKTSRRQTNFLLVISVCNKSKCVSNKSLFHKLYLRNLRRIQNASLRTQ